MLRLVFKYNLENVQFFNIFLRKNYQTSSCLLDKQSIEKMNNDNVENKSNNLMELSSDEIVKRLMSFYDLPDNWKQSSVQTGRAWRMDELRIKSNADLHKLWYILYKERNMLLTMQQAAKDNLENMASPERIDKVEESMKNIEEVVKERNRAYWKLEVGDDHFVERRRAFRKDIFGRWRWIASSQHLIPYWMNSEWRKYNAPGFGKEVMEFNRRLHEIKMNKQVSKHFKAQFYCRQLMKRFPDLDLDYLQEKFPNINVKQMKENLNEYSLKDRVKKFNSIFYHKRNNI